VAIKVVAIRAAVIKVVAIRVAAIKVVVAVSMTAPAVRVRAAHLQPTARFPSS
jgi:hypothetical protein